jgi:hypothetical protein
MRQANGSSTSGHSSSSKIAQALEAAKVHDLARLLNREADAADRELDYQTRLREARTTSLVPGLAPPAAVGGDDMGIQIDSPTTTNHFHQSATPAPASANGSGSTLGKLALLTAAAVAGGVPAAIGTYLATRPAAAVAPVSVPVPEAANWDLRLIPAR